VKRISQLRFLLIFALQIGLLIGMRVMLPAEFAGNENTDYRTFYRPVAAAIVTGEGIRLNGAPALRYPPGYPALLAGAIGLANLTGMSEDLLLSLFVALSAAASAVVLAMLSESIWGKRWGWIAGVAWASYPLSLWMYKQSNSEAPFVLLLYLSLLATWRVIAVPNLWLALLAGVMAGFSMLVRPIGVGVSAILAVLVFALVKERPLTRTLLAACLLAGSLLAVAPWELWVYRQTGRTVPLSTNGPASMVDGLAFAADHEQAGAGFFLVSPTLLPVMRAVRAQRGKLGSTGGVLGTVASLAKREPLKMGLLLATKAARSWYATESGRLEKPSLIVQMPYLLLSMLAVFLSCKAGERYRGAGLAVGLLVLYFWVMTIAVLSISRYTVPAIGLLFLLWPAIPIWWEGAKVKVVLSSTFKVLSCRSPEGSECLVSSSMNQEPRTDVHPDQFSESGTTTQNFEPRTED
jgi:4-amino-4-deoxy-L-arabinose transferase-like glycosyltransferase